MLDVNQFREVIVLPALHGLQLYTKELAELLVFTCAVESAGGTYIKQIHGPAVGIFQIEPAVFTELWVNCIIRNPSYINLLTMNFHVHQMPKPDELMTDLKLSAAICGLYYKWKKVNPLQMDAEYLWGLYKEFYNTKNGKAEHETSLKAYAKFCKN